MFFFFNDTATTEIYTLSLHDALPIYARREGGRRPAATARSDPHAQPRSEEHTSELQSHVNLVCRLLLEKKNITTQIIPDGVVILTYATQIQSLHGTSYT